MVAAFFGNWEDFADGGVTEVEHEMALEFADEVARVAAWR
jgi:hypothetical protein